MSKKRTPTFYGLPWFKFWTGNFRSMTDHLSNAETGAYIRLLAFYWDNNGLPFDKRALTRIARIEPCDDVALEEIVSDFFIVKDGAFRHEELDALRIEAIGEEEANRRRTLPARVALAEQRRSVTFPVTETEVDVDVEGEVDPDSDPESESDGNSDSDEEPDEDAEQGLQVAGESGSQITAQTTPTSEHQSASIKPDGGAQGGAAPAVSAAKLGISFRLKGRQQYPAVCLCGRDPTLETEVPLSSNWQKDSSHPRNQSP